MKGFILKTTFVVLFVISLFANITLGFNLSDQKKAHKQSETRAEDLDNELANVKKKLTEAQNSIEGSKTAYDPETKHFVEEFFKIQYEYTTSSYKARFDKIKSYVSNKVYGQLTAAGVPDTPKVSFKNTITDLQLFLTPSGNGEVSGLVLLQTKYEVEGLKNPKVTQVFKIKLVNKKINELETVGTFAEPVQES
ncbi:hypothetical protein [Bacillus amyloliquefaciens]|uniref:hypothetical protein n=1 Tax=Bacillus amyloliquefaciens TaxID=1390 RepID=UPI000E23017B|nr:hypothetical protein [Bacillus amyloliquefaciens]RDY83094.1 hypothetical protein C3733_19715 [Bacillus amyloliquefaciens]